MKFFKNILGFAQVISGDNIFMFAAQAAYYIMLASIPSVMMLLSLAKFILPVDEADLLIAVTPFVPEIIKNPIEHILAELYSVRSFSVTSASLVSAIWSASRGIAAVERGIKSVYHITEKSSLVSRILSGFFHTVIFILMMVSFLILTVFGNGIISYLRANFSIFRGALVTSPIFSAAFACGLASVLFAFFYYSFSGRKLRFYCHLPGALLSASGWVLASRIFSFYIENFANYSYVYGSLTVIVLMMLWTYLCMVIFLFGGEINKLLLVIRKKNTQNNPPLYT